MRIVFDVDDTISKTENGDYINAIPDIEVINKINDLYNQGFEIYLYTSRGMLSCNNDINKAEIKNKDILISWLNNNNVKYNEIIFGKPLADLYVDDKAMNIQDFKKESFYQMHGGGSGKNIYKLGNIVKKNLESYKKIEDVLIWTKEAKNFCKYPNIFSTSKEDNSIFYNYIEGKTLDNCLTNDSLLKLILIISNFKQKQYNSFDINYHIDILYKNLLDNNIKKRIIFCEKLLKDNRNILISNASFSHGDTILSNIIIDNQNDFIFIDPQFNIKASSYLLDFAKLRMSLDNYEYNFNISKNKINTQYKKILDNYLKLNNIYNIVIILEYMYIIRLYRYKTEEQKKIVLKMLKKIEREQKWKIE